MDRLPDDVEAILLRALSAYLKATPSTELPARLRRFQNFRPKSLAAQRGQILGALDDEGLRALIAEWLDEKPSLSKADAAILRIAVERPDGWFEDLASRSAPTAPAATATSSKATAEREREKLKKARDDARRRQDEATREIVALRARIDRLEQELKEERSSSSSLKKEVEAARRAAAKASGDLEREQRKARSSLERAEATAQKARGESKEAKRELQTVRRELDRIKSAARRPRQAPKQKRATPKGPRKALAVPKGRFEDDPETLDVWLDAPDVHLLVDGYNASMSRSGFANLELPKQRERLVEELTKLVRRKKVKATVVFDGSDVATVGRRPRGPVRVQYSAPDEIADDHLVALLETLPSSPVVVATSDRELQERAAALGATVATSEQLLGLLR